MSFLSSQIIMTDYNQISSFFRGPLNNEVRTKLHINIKLFLQNILFSKNKSRKIFDECLSIKACNR